MSFIDTIFSSILYMALIIIVLFFTCIFLAQKKPFKKRLLNIIYRGLMYGIAVFGFVAPQIFPYGLATGFKSITVGNTTVCVAEEYKRGGGKSVKMTVCRLTILDKNTGERKARRYIGSGGDIIGQKGDTLAYLYNKTLYVINAVSLQEIYHVDENEWMKKGMQDIQPNNQNSGVMGPYLTMQGKDGNRYWYDPFTKQQSKDPLPGLKGGNKTSAILPSSTKYQHEWLQVQYITNSSRQQLVPGRHPEMFGAPGDESFISPDLVCIDTAKKCFVFVHYTTIDKEEIIVEAKDFDFKTLWKKDSKTLGATDSYNADVNNISKYVDGLLYFNIGGYVLCAEPLTGKIIWRVRL